MARIRIFNNLVPGYFHPKPATKSHCSRDVVKPRWNLSFRRPLNDWEIQRLVEFYKVLGQFKGTINAQDSLEWQDHNRDNFSVRRAYKKINPCNSQGNGWPWKLIWKTKIPYKVSCFTWFLAKQVVLTQENLMKRNIQLSHNCLLCGEEEVETVNHLFLYYRITNILWNGLCLGKLRKP